VIGAPAVFRRQQTIAPIGAEAPCRTSRRVLRTARSGQGIRSGGAASPAAVTSAETRELSDREAGIAKDIVGTVMIM
jgi:hypothetical protein